MFVSSRAPVVHTAWKHEDMAFFPYPSCCSVTLFKLSPPGGVAAGHLLRRQQRMPSQYLPSPYPLTHHSCSTTSLTENITYCRTLLTEITRAVTRSAYARRVWTNRACCCLTSPFRIPTLLTPVIFLALRVEYRFIHLPYRLMLRQTDRTVSLYGGCSMKARVFSVSLYLSFSNS